MMLGGMTARTAGRMACSCVVRERPEPRATLEDGRGGAGAVLRPLELERDRGRSDDDVAADEVVRPVARVGPEDERRRRAGGGVHPGQPGAGAVDAGQ